MRKGVQNMKNLHKSLHRIFIIYGAVIIILIIIEELYSWL